MKPSLEKAKKKLEIAEAAFKKLVHVIQKKCKHEHLAECDYYSNGWSIFEPIRICLDCGMSEEGWGCGYIVLKAPEERIGRINRDKLYSLREGLMITDSKKGPLLRKEITLDQLIDGVEVED